MASFIVVRTILNTSDFISKYSLKNTGLLAQEKCVSQLCELDEKTQDFLFKALLGFSQHKVLKLGDPYRDLNKFSFPFMMPKTITKSGNNC